MNQPMKIQESEIVERAALVSNARTAEVAALIVQCGGDPCGSCKQFTRQDWLDMVNYCACVLGYWDWVLSMAEEQDVDLPALQPEAVTPNGNADHRLVGSYESDEEKIALWKARSFEFKARRTWNVLSAFLKGWASARQCYFGLCHPAHVVGLAIKRSHGGGMLLVCPAAREIEFPTDEWSPGEVLTYRHSGV